MISLGMSGSAKVEKLQMSRLQQGWLLLALVVTCLPIWFYVPIWVATICLIALTWRFRVLWRGSAQPSRKITAAMAVVSSLIVLWQWYPPIGLEPMSTLLIICCALKFLEMRVIREARTVLYLCYFIAAIQLVYEQTVFHFLLAVLSIILTLTAQNMAERDPWQQYSFRSFSLFPLKSVGWIALVSIPLTIVIFLFAPRVPSFWGVPVAEDQAVSGISDSMSPGSIGELARSSKLAFRVGFEEEVPPRRQLYWRALVLSDYDGQTWTNRENFMTIQDGGRTHFPGSDRSPVEWRDDIIYEGEPIVYDVYQEPTSQHWLFALAAPVSDEQGLGMTKGMRLVSRQPVTQRVKYSVTSYPDYSMTNEILDYRDRYRNLHLPSEFNPRTREFAESLAEEGLTPDQLVSRLFDLFRAEHTYTLNPGSFGTDSIDEFLFDRPRGFCEHFAQATVFFLRAAGVPARIISGYQGGELNEEGNYLMVYQYDAHAWAEYWVEGRGWVQADPTTAVSPARIELGAREVLREEPDFLADDVFSLAAMQDINWLNWLRLRMDSVNYLWVSWILGYDNEQQFDMWQGLFGDMSLKKLLFILCGFTVLVMGGIYFHIWWSSENRKRPRAQRQFDQFRAELVKAGVELEPGYTPSRLAEQSRGQNPEHNSRIDRLCQLFEQHFYANEDHQQEISDLLRKRKL
jgi:transglutaminase-like putative cysteine protease